MANRIQFSFLNPLAFFRLTPEETAQYLSAHIDTHPYIETIAPWQTRRPYYQPWQNSDTIPLQFASDYGPLRIKVVDGYERVYANGLVSQVAQNENDASFFIYEHSLSLAGIAEGVYFLLLEAGQDSGGLPVDKFISEPLKIAAVQKDTVLLEYRNSQFKGNTVFETGFSPAIRLHGRVVLKSPSAKDTLFEDEELSQRLVAGKPFEVYSFEVGGASGIPDALAKRLGRILTCTHTYIDGVRYTKTGEGLQPNGEKGYPMRTWSCDLRDTENKDHVEYSNNAYNAGPDQFIVSVDRKGFGNETSGEEQIISIG